jgi:radical SAM-linked protein
MARVRVRFAKLGKIRWTSHRDVARMWERAFRRIDLPLAYSEGFSPRPKVSFGLALPTGHESLAEYLDIDVADTPAGAEILAGVATLPARLSAALPEGVDALCAAAVPPGTPSLQEAVTSCAWEWTATRADGSDLVPADMADRADALLAAATVTVTRSRKGAAVTDDIRDAVVDLRVIGAISAVAPDHDGRAVGAVRLAAELACQPRSLRPSEVLAGLGADLVERDTRRTHQWISRDGARSEPLAVPAAATDAPPALGWAS